MKKLFSILPAFLLSAITASSQTPFTDYEYVDANNIKASVAMHGDLWWRPDSMDAGCFFPKTTKKNPAFVGALWMSGHDQMASLATSAQTYRYGIDFWPGPASVSGPLPYATSEKWARIWKVSYIDINNFKAQTTHTLTNTPAVILEWPAKNNPYAKGRAGAALTITTDMAPFVDVNADGSYNPLQGDYPELKGDQMLWWVFNDNGPTHNNTMTSPLGVEIKARAYAYTRGVGAINNIIFYEYDIKNVSSRNYSDYRVALWSDADLGYYNDDYLAFDSVRRMAISMNGDAIDGLNGEPNAYGSAPPVTGYTLLQLPGDNGTNYVPVGSFMYFNNDNTTMGNPQSTTEYSNYMRATWRDGIHLVNDYVGYGVNTKGRGVGPQTNYVFPGDPSNALEWSECQSVNAKGDRRMVLSSPDYAFNSGANIKFAFALVVTDTSHKNTCDSISFDGVKALADTAWKYYRTPLTPIGVSIQQLAIQKDYTLFPNPAKDVLQITWQGGNPDLKVYDVNGRVLNIPFHYESGNLRLEVKDLTKGIYMLHCTDGKFKISTTFIKE